MKIKKNKCRKKVNGKGDLILYVSVPKHFNLNVGDEVYVLTLDSLEELKKQSQKELLEKIRLQNMISNVDYAFIKSALNYNMLNK